MNTDRTTTVLKGCLCHCHPQPRQPRANPLARLLPPPRRARAIRPNRLARVAGARQTASLTEARMAEEPDQEYDAEELDDLTLAIRLLTGRHDWKDGAAIRKRQSSHLSTRQLPPLGLTPSWLARA